MEFRVFVDSSTEWLMLEVSDSGKQRGPSDEELGILQNSLVQPLNDCFISFMRTYNCTSVHIIIEESEKVTRYLKPSQIALVVQMIKEAQKTIDAKELKRDRGTYGFRIEQLESDQRVIKIFATIGFYFACVVTGLYLLNQLFP